MTIVLKYSRRKHGFHVGDTGMFIPAPRNEAEDVIEFLSRKMCDNPGAQAALGVLGETSVAFEVA
jgi:hypothetical protein